MIPDELSCGEKPLLESTDHIHGLCNKLFQKIKELFGITITPEEVKAFAEAEGCFKYVVPLAEHICLVLIEATQDQHSKIIGLKQSLRDKIQSIIDVTDPKVFEDLNIPQKQTNPKLYSLAVQFLNR